MTIGEDIMITTLIVEDNIEQLHALENVISSSFRSMRILSSTNYEAAKKIVDTESIHFFLLDIELSPLKEAPSGITLGNTLQFYFWLPAWIKWKRLLIKHTATAIW